jgi:hypothetical protein
MTLWRWEGGLLWKGHRRSFAVDVDLDLEQRMMVSSSGQTGHCGRVLV